MSAYSKTTIAGSKAHVKNLEPNFFLFLDQKTYVRFLSTILFADKNLFYWFNEKERLAH